MAERVKQVYAVDVSTEITRKVDPPANFQLVISNGVSVDAPAGSVDLAYSSNLMEHLHPDDAAEQLKNLVRTLKPGGAYICITPSGLSGPHDVSKYFDETPTGFHLREYSTTELAQVLRQAGFARVRPYFWAKQKLIFVPLIWVIVLEKLLSWLPKRVCRRICRRMPFKLLVGRVIAYMPKAAAN
jgi:SAM-dependent methyltransferase